jgi:hypothetical protein
MASPIFSAAGTPVDCYIAGDVTRPAVAEGDLMVLFVTMYHSDRTLTLPAGWAVIQTLDGNSPFSGEMTAYWKVAGASEPTTYALSAGGGGGATDFSAVIIKYTGAHATAPIQISAQLSNASSTSVPVPSVTTTTSDTLLVAFYGDRGNDIPVTFTPPTDMTERVDHTAGSPTRSYAIADVSVSTAGPTGAKTATASSALVTWSMAFAIAPAAGGNSTPTFTGPDITNKTMVEDVAMTSDTVSDSFSDSDALTFSAIGSWPDGVTVTSAGVIQGTPTTPGTYASLKVRATDTASQTVDSNTFTITVTAAADTVVPTMTGTITATSVTTTGMTIDWSTTTRSDNIAITGYEYSLDGTTYVAAGTGTSYAITGLSPATSYTVRLRCFDAAGNRSTPALTVTQITATASDSTAPAMTGSIAVSAVTASGFTLTWSAATDAVGVTGYEVACDTGSTPTYVNVGNVLTITETGKAAGTLYNIKVRAYDAANNKATPLTTTATTSAAPASGTITTKPICNNTGTNWAALGVTGVTSFSVFNAATDVLVMRKTGLTLNSNSILVVADGAYISGSTYYYRMVLSNGAVAEDTVVVA